MDTIAERFQSAFDIVSDYDGYIDAQTVLVEDSDVNGVQIESSGMGEYKRLVYRSFDVANPRPGQKCGMYCRIEMRGDDYRAVLLDSFANGRDENVAYFYKVQQPQTERPQRALALIESALGKLLTSKTRV